MAQELTNKYFVRRTTTDSWTDVTTLWTGARVLSVSGFGDVGDAVNVYNEQWIDGQAEDFYVTKKETINGVTRDVIVRKNVDLTMTIIVSQRYTSTTIDEQTIYRSIVDWVCKHGDFYIRSAYTNEEAHVVCINSFKPTSQKLNRGQKSYILASIPLHALDLPTAYST